MPYGLFFCSSRSLCSRGVYMSYMYIIMSNSYYSDASKTYIIMAIYVVILHS